MDYKKKYEKLVDAVKVLRDNNPSDEGIQNWVNDNVLEFKESEDDRIRKEIIGYLKSKYESPNAIKCDYEKWIAWLEKQKPTTDIQNLTWEDIEKIGEFINTVQNENPNGIGAECLYTDVLERFLDGKQTKQKPADKVEPRFKVGDWIVDKSGFVQQVLDFRCGIYTCTYNSFTTDYESNYHLWLIKDAKDGDVLVCEDYGYTSYLLIKSFSDKTIELHCWYNGQTNNLHNSTEVITREDARIHPATKEQRDLLFQKMKEAGYVWDAEKKELKKAEQNLAWSEDDEETLGWLCTFLKEYGNLFYGGNEENVIDWLKSLKDRMKPQWKPSDEQLDALHDAAVYVDKSMFPYPKGILMKMYKQLKKLKEE